MGLFGGSTQVSTSSNNIINFNPTISSGNSGGYLLPDNSSSLSNPTYQLPYQKDTADLQYSFDPQFKANVPFNGATVQDSGTMAQDNTKTNATATDAQQSTVPSFLTSAATKLGIPTSWLMIGGVVALLLILKKR